MTVVYVTVLVLSTSVDVTTFQKVNVTVMVVTLMQSVYVVVIVPLIQMETDYVILK